MEMSTDAIVLLKADHKEIREQFRRFAAAGGECRGGEGQDRRQDHRAADGAHLHRERDDVPARSARLLPDLEDDVLESYEEHHVADVLVVELAAMEPTRSASTRRQRC